MLLCNCIGRAGKGSRGKLLQAASGNSGGSVMYSQLVIWHHTDWVWCGDFRQKLRLNCDQAKWNNSAFSYFLPYFRCMITLNVSKTSDQLFFCSWLCVMSHLAISGTVPLPFCSHSLFMMGSQSGEISFKP